MNEQVEALLEQLSHEHPDLDLHVTQIKEHAFIWRPLKREEFRQLQTLDVSPGKKEEIICALCCVWPSDYDWENPVKAGHPSTVANDILNYSGFWSKEETMSFLAAEERSLQHLDNFMDVVIAAAFPSIRPEEPSTWTNRHALWMFARAKWKLENIDKVKLSIDFSGEQDQTRQSIPSAPVNPTTFGQTDSSHEEFFPETSWWPDDVDYGEDEPIPHIEGFPDIEEKPPSF